MSSAPGAAGLDPARVPSPQPPAARRHPLALPHFRNLWLGGSISLLGDQFYLVALPWLVLQLTGSSLALGTMLMAAGVPRAALMLVGGAVIDRFSARRVLMTTATVRAVLVGTVAALLWLHVVELWHLYLLTFAFGVADAFSFPAGPALIPTLVEPQQLPAANAVMQSSAVAAQMLGPAPAGLVIRRWGIAAAMFFDAVSFLAVLAAIVGLPEPRRAAPAAAGGAGGAAGATPAGAAPAGVAAAAAPVRPSMVRSIGLGLRAVWHDPPLRALMLLFAALNLCVSGPIGVGLAAVAKFRFGSAAVFGTFLTCFGGGMLSGVLLGGLIKQPRRRGLQVAVMGGLTGLEMIAMGLALRAVVIGTLMALMGLGVGFVNVQFAGWMQQRVERALLGRVASVLMFCAVGLVPLSYAIAGALAQWSFVALFAGAGTLLVAAAAMALAGKGTRQID
jgi:MFS family permease